MNQEQPPPTPTLGYSTSAAPEETALRSVDLFTIALQLLGIYQLIQGLPSLTYVPIFLLGGRSGVGVQEALSWLLPTAVSLAIGVVLLAGARWIATRLLGAARDRERGLRPPGKRLQAVAFAVAGVLVFIDGAIEVIRELARVYFSGVEEISGPDVVQDTGIDLGSLLPGAAQLVIGMCLFFGAKALAAFWHRIRTQPNPIAGDDRGGGQDVDVRSAGAAAPSARRSG